MPEPRLDLHLHSARSDGRHAPLEVLRRAAAGGLDAVALTDHDVEPIYGGDLELDGRRLRVIPGAEVSGTHQGRELHLLVWFPGEPSEEARAWLRAGAQARARRYDAAAAKLGLDPAPPEAHAGALALTRHHLARAMVAAGRVPHVQHAFPHLGAGVVPPLERTYLDAIRAAVAFGAVTSWAHPALGDAQRFLADFVRAGLHAVEADRPGLDRPTRNGLRRLAKQHRIGISGGSDWHGWWQGELGTYTFTGEAARALAPRLGVATG